MNSQADSSATIVKYTKKVRVLIEDMPKQIFALKFKIWLTDTSI